MVDLLEQIRLALDELTPLLHRRAVDIEMPRLTVGADTTTSVPETRSAAQ